MCLNDYRELAKVLGTPPMFTDVLPLILKPQDVELLLKVSEGEPSVKEISEILDLPASTVESRLNSLFKRGFVRKKREGETRYSLKSFNSIVSRHLSEGRAGPFGRYVSALANYTMQEHIERAKADPHPEAKVLPIPGAIEEPVSVILPQETASSILRRARTISIRNCDCRMAYRNCDGPLRTCLALDDFSEELVERGVAEEVSLEEAERVLMIADEKGLVHQALYTDWLRGEVFDICSCCPCCCTYLRSYRDYGVRHHIAKSGMVAKVDPEKCCGCGVCLERCIFDARGIEEGKSKVSEEECFGCGLCVTTCPTGASRLVSQS